MGDREEEENKLKFLVIGESQVGKSFLINKYISRNWEIKNVVKIQKTNGIDINVELINNENENFIIEFVEFEGDFDKIEYFNIFTNIYFKEKSKFTKLLPFHGIIYVFDTQCFESLAKCNKWLKWFYNEMKIKIFEENEISNKEKRVKYSDFLDIPILFLGNKTNFKKNKQMNLVNSKINNMMNKQKKFILSNFAFKNTKNLYYFDNTKEEEFFQFLEVFIFQILNLMNNSNNFKNTNIVNQEEIPDFSNYCLKEFIYLKTFNYKLKKNFLSKLIYKILNLRR